ncbi:MAG: hypothetical protein LBE39_11870 [Flavobacteriaceae bacterium]|jgi:hypothetical protein|nr:hypothetical protein [Flavobacteriaceae bacterium]
MKNKNTEIKVNTKNEKEIKRKKYTPPTLTVSFVKMENGIDASSGLTLLNVNSPVREQWDIKDRFITTPEEEEESV